MKRLIIPAIIITSLLAMASCSSQNQDPIARYFGAERYSEITEKCSDEDKLEVQPILDEIEAAFSYDDKNNDCEEQLGRLSRYCLCKSSYPEVVSERHSVEFVTARITGDRGYIWIRYNQEGLDKNKKVTTGSWDILSRIEIQKINGRWTAVDVDEAP